MPPHFFDELRRALADGAGRPALWHRGRAYPYAELDVKARRCAGLLQRLGVGPGERVALVTGDKLPFLAGHLGALYAGAVSLPLNPGFPRDELRYFLADSGARAAVVGAAARPMVEALRPGLPELRAVVADADAWDAPAGAFREPDRGPDDPCLMIYSSGTTGWPKGVVHVNANLAASLHALRDCWRVTADDVVVNVLPLYHIHGLSFAVHLALLAGACVRIEDRFEPAATLEAIGQGTVFMAVPPIYYRLLEEPAFRPAARTWARARLFTCGSAPIRPEVLPKLEEVLGRPVINRYGMTEAHVIASLPLDGPWPWGSVGLPLAGVERRVVRADGTPAAVGEVGAVHVRGPNLFRAYWGKPEATRAAFTSGWFDTGDLGLLDEAGFLTLVGRSNDLIITNGYNVYPQVVERVLNACPGVRESAVVGLPDPRRGERVAAVVVPADAALDEGQVRAYCAEHLVDYQRPQTVVLADALPRNALGKVLRRELRERLRAER